MKNILIFPIGSTAACRYAEGFFRQAGIPLVDHPAPEVTHLLLDIPSFAADGSLRQGGALEAVLERLPAGITVVGGNLNHPALSGYRTLDLLQDAQYLAVNAAITAECALQAAAPRLTTILQDTPTLILGWGRIGKCLAHLLQAIGVPVTVAARKESDRAMIRALGLKAVEIGDIPKILSKMRLLFNTVPELLLNEKQLASCRDCVLVDLASKPGLEGENVLYARGLPGLYAPESSGRLIADTFLRLYKKEVNT